MIVLQVLDSVLEEAKKHIAAGHDVRNFAAEHRTGVPYVNLSKVGKKAAGRLLDGQEWNETPVAREVTK